VLARYMQILSPELLARVGSPIIEQDIARVTHRASAQELAHIGRDIERTVLARAVRWHLEDRVLVHGTRTVVFT
jgi:formyltetrahydrofolate deformylase